MNELAAKDGYGQDYLGWKNWGGSGFGALTSAEEAYFAAEMAKLPLDRTRPLHVLEIGFGNGAFLGFARKQGWAVSGTELIAELVQAADAAGINAKVGMDGFEAASFDLIVAFDVLEHIPADDAVEFMASIKRVARPGALFLARYPNGDSPFSLSYQNGDLTHVNAIGSSKLRHLAQRSGAELLYISGEARVSTGLGFKGKVRMAISAAAARIINKAVPLLFLPGWAGTDFCSPNAVAALRL